MCKLNLLLPRSSLPRSSLLTVCKSFIRLYLDYENMTYDQPNLTSLANKIESVEYNAGLATTGVIWETSK